MRLLAKLLLLSALLSPLPALAQSPDKLVIATGVDPGFGIFYIGKEAGIFRRNGLDVDLKTGPSGSAMVGLLIGAQVQAAFGGEMAGIQSFNIDPNVVVAAEGSLLSRWFAVVAHDVPDLRALKGKRVGVPRGTSAELFWRALCGQSGVRSEDFDVVNVESPEIAAALQRGNIEAGVTWEPWVTRIVGTIPETKVLRDSEGVFGPRVYIYVNKGWAEKNQSAASRFLKSLVEANDLIASTPDVAATYISKYLNLDEKLTRSLMSKLRYDVRFDRDSLDNLSDAEAQLKALGKLSKPVDYRSFIYSDLLRSARPGSVDETSSIDKSSGR